MRDEREEKRRGGEERRGGKMLTNWLSNWSESQFSWLAGEAGWLLAGRRAAGADRANVESGVTVSRAPPSPP